MFEMFVCHAKMSRLFDRDRGRGGPPEEFSRYTGQGRPGWLRSPSMRHLQVTPATNIAASGTQGGPLSPSSFSYTLSVASGCFFFGNDRHVHGECKWQ
jgi:hypothetical protein